MSGLPSWAVKDARVVCVDDANQAMPWHEPEQGEFVTAGQVYTIRWAGIASDWQGDYAGVRLEGVARFDEDGHDAPFSVDRFRPLITLEDDLEAHFRVLLRQPVSDKEPAL